MRAARAVLVVAIALVVVGRAPGAWACSCAAPAPGDEERFYLERAKAAFVGVAIARQDPEGRGQVLSSGRPIHWTFDVEEVLKGHVRDPAEVTSAAQGGSCGYVFRLGYRYRVHTYTDEEGRAATGLCSGDEELGYAGVPSSRAATPPPHVAATPTRTTVTSRTPTPTISRPAGGSIPTPSLRGLAVRRTADRGGSGASRAIAIALAVLAATGVAMAFARRTRD